MRISSVAATSALLCCVLQRAAGKSTSHSLRGWSSWSLSAITNSPVYGRNWLNSTNVLAQSDAMARSVLQSAWSVGGNKPYINIDSFWASDPTQVVDAFGRYITDSSRFPTGMRAICDHVHANNQLCGIYANPGVLVAAVKQKTPIMNASGCTADDIAWKPLTKGNTFGDMYRVNFSHPCAQTYYNSMGAQFADFGVDFVKLDAVSPGSADATVDNRLDVAAWSKALERTGRDIWLTISWRINASFAADFSPSSNAWRTSDDVDCYCNVLSNWNSAIKRFTEVVPFLPWVQSGHTVPDLDSLNVGQGALDGLTDDEKLLSVTLWAITSGPIYTGNDLVKLDLYGATLLTHGDVLAINAAGTPAAPVQGTANAPQQVWRADFTNGSSIVALFNLGSSPANVTLNLSAASTIRDVWMRSDLGVVSGSFTALLNSHAAQLLRVTPVAA